MNEKIVKLIATSGGLGYSSIAPGTAGSLGGVVIYMIIKNSAATYLAVTLALLAAGFIVSGPAERIFNKKDAKPIVIDEVCGLLISLFMIPFSWAALIIGFLLFRTMDVIKPFPCRRIEKFSGSLGVMGDDILVGIYSNIALRITLHFIIKQ